MNEDYSNEVVSLGKGHDGVFGFIGNGSSAHEIESLRNLVGEAKMIWTPGINLKEGDGSMGQDMEIQEMRFWQDPIV